MEEQKLLIVGAGPTGLVLALWLTKMGVPVRVIDKTKEPGTTSRATVFHARNLELYHQMGIDQLAVDGGIEFTAVNLWVNGRQAAHMPVMNIGRDLSPYPYILIFPQDRHERLLVDQLREAGVEVERETELISFQQVRDGVQVTWKKNEKSENGTYRYLAGCDGAHSSVRKGMNINFPGGDYEHTFYVADINADGIVTNGEMHAAMDKSDFMIVFPMKGEGNIRVIGVVRNAEGEKQAFTWEDVNQEIISRLRMNVKKVNWFSTYKVHHRVASSFRQGRVFILGDAAHIHSPVGGQGMNTGIGDAINLAWKLREVLNASAPDSLLDSFEVERMAFAKTLVSTTDRAFTLITARGWLATRLRLYVAPFIVPFLFRLAVVKRLMFKTVSQISIRYPQSKLSVGRAGKRRGGDRLPWVQFKNKDGSVTDNFQSLAGMPWQVHCYGKVSSQWREECVANRILLNVFEWTAAAKKAGLERDAVYVIRPDGYIGLAGRNINVANIISYLRHGKTDSARPQ